MRARIALYTLVLSLLMVGFICGVVLAGESVIVLKNNSVIKTTDIQRPVPEFDRVVEVKDPSAYYKCMDEAASHHIRSRRYELMEKCVGIEI